MYLTLFDLEQIMKRALITGLLVFAVVFMAGVMFGWQYALMLAFMLLIAINLTQMARRQ